jgi:hypothetical protein
MEEIHHNVPVGTRLLIRRETRNGLTTDHLTTRVSRATFYGNWTHQTTVYRDGDLTPYPFDMDCFHARFDLLANHHRNNIPFEALALPLRLPQVQAAIPAALAAQAAEFLAPPPIVNPLPEGHNMWVDEEDHPMIFPLDPIVGERQLSSADLFSWNQ